MDGGAPFAEPTAVQMNVPDWTLVERLDNSHVWPRMFAFMGLRERIQVEMVNKRLRSVMLALWARERSFDATSVIGDPQKRVDGVLAICSRIGDGLRSLKLSDTLTLDWSKDLSSISNACPNIESIDFHVEVRAHAFFVPLNLRFDMFIGLKALSFSWSLPEVDGELDWVCAPARVFLSIPCSIERIDRLEGRWNKEDAYFKTGQLEQFFADRPQLRAIRLSGLRTRDGSKADVFRVIAEHCPLLKKVCLWDSSAIDFHGLVSLELMEEICFSSLDESDIPLSDAELIEICERNPLVEVLALKDFTCAQLGLSALCAVAALRNLRELSISLHDMPEMQVTKFIHDFASNSGASLQRLDLGCSCHLSTAAIEVLAARCTKLRYLHFSVSGEGATPASIRHLVDCLVADPSWNPNEQQLSIRISTVDAPARAPFVALTDPTANLPAGVNLLIDSH